MTFINPRLGNGFVIRDADSTRDQEHYFTGAKKHLEFAATAVLTSSYEVCYASGSLTASAYAWTFKDVATHPTTGRIYATGQRQTGSITQWVTVMSPDSGSTWNVVDVTGSYNAVYRSGCGNKIFFAPNGAILVAGSCGSNSVSGFHNFHIRSSSVDDSAWVTCASLGGDGTFSDTAGRHQGIIIGHPTNPNTILWMAGQRLGPINVMTSSVGGHSGTFSLSSTFTFPGAASDEFPYNSIYSGSTLFVCGYTNDGTGDAWIMSSSDYGSGAYGTVYAKTSTSDMSMNKVVLDSSGNFWACGGGTSLPILVSSSQGGRPHTWRTSSLAQVAVLSGNNFFESMYKDSRDNLWIMANSATGSMLFYKTPSTRDDWVKTVVNERTTRRIYGPITEDGKYKNLIMIVHTASSPVGGGSSTGQEARIERGFPDSIVNQGASSITLASASQLRFGLSFRESIKSIEFDINQLTEYFGQPSKQVDFVDAPSFSFTFSGSSGSIQSIGLRAFFSGVSPFFELKQLGSITVGTTSASFDTGKIVNVPRTIGLVEIQVSGSPLGTFRIENFHFDYFQKLTDAGVVFFKDVENQDLNFTNLNPAPFKKVE